MAANAYTLKIKKVDAVAKTITLDNAADGYITWEGATNPVLVIKSVAIDDTITDLALTTDYTWDESNDKITFINSLPDLVLIHLSSNSGASNRVSVDFQTQYAEGGTDTNAFLVPDDPGSHNLEIQSINDETTDDVGTAYTTTKVSYLAGYRPSAAKSTVTMEKSYLVKFIDQKYNVTVTLDGADGKDITTGNYQVILESDLQ